MAESLRDRFMQCSKLKQPGIMRSELLDYVRAAAEILDYLYQQHSVQHLGLNPRNLLLDKGWLQLAEFGLNQLVWLPSGQDVAQRNARYTAPGTVPAAGEPLGRSVQPGPDLRGNADRPCIRSRARIRGNGVHPTWKSCRPQDQAVIARALHADPAQRWASATEMALALEGTGLPQEQQQLEQTHEDSFVKMLKKTRRVERPAAVHQEHFRRHSSARSPIWSSASAARWKVSSAKSAPSLSEQDQVLEHRFQVCMPLGSARQHIEPFFAELGGQPVRQEEACYEMSLPLPGTVLAAAARQAYPASRCAST